MEKYCVYKHTSPSGKVYIGITRQIPEVRWKAGHGYTNNPHFFNAIKKYGWENFKHEILSTGLTRLEAGNEEKRLIQEYQSSLPDFGYNHSLGGDFGVKHTKEVRKKISEKATARYSVPENRDKMRHIHLGKHPTEETKAKMRAAKIGKPHPLSAETRRKMSESNKISFANSKNAEEVKQQCRERGRARSKPVSCYSLDGEFIATYCSAHEAERVTGVRNGNISNCCNNKQKSSGGFRWRYA